MSRSADPRTKGWVVVTLAYLSATLLAWWSLGLMPVDLHPMIAVGIADVVGTVVVFAWSMAYDNSSLYDPYWSVAPLLIGPWLVLHPMSHGAVPLRQALVLLLLFAWGLRLTFNWLRHWQGLGHEDWRYVNIRASTGRAYWLVSFLGIHLMPTLLVLAGCLSLWPALVTGGAPLSVIDGVGAALCTSAVAIEAIADRQLHDFRRSRPAPGTILDRGLWGWSRHPNYFGEITLWWGLFAFGWAAQPGTWWPLVGPVSITLLFVFISVPLIEKRMHARRPGWAAHCRRVSALVPWPPRRGR